MIKCVRSTFFLLITKAVGTRLMQHQLTLAAMLQVSGAGERVKCGFMRNLVFAWVTSLACRLLTNYITAVKP